MLSVKSFVLLLVCFEASAFLEASKKLLASNLRPLQPQSVQNEAALALIKRILPSDYSKLFSIQIEENKGQKDFGLLSTFTIENVTYVNIKASSGVMATWTFHEYLKRFCNIQISWQHRQLRLSPFEYFSV